MGDNQTIISLEEGWTQEIQAKALQPLEVPYYLYRHLITILTKQNYLTSRILIHWLPKGCSRTNITLCDRINLESPKQVLKVKSIPT